MNSFVFPLIKNYTTMITSHILFSGHTITSTVLTSTYNTTSGDFEKWLPNPVVKTSPPRIGKVVVSKLKFFRKKLR